jgi:xylulokinase
MILLGIDLGSSSVKASLLDAATGQVVGSAQFPKTELSIEAPQPGFAEQDPAVWWDATVHAVQAAVQDADVDAGGIDAIGIAYQMHGLVCLDKDQQPLRPSIIWCDSRAVEIGEQAFNAIGHEKCLQHLLNSPGNFTASKLAWVKKNQPELYDRIDTICLPGDYLAAKITGKVATTVSGLSEGIFWDFKENQPASFLLEQLGIDESLLADIVPTFGRQGEVSNEAAETLGIKAGTPITYRAGDQPNNALSLNVLNPGEVAATAGTSGVVYGVSDTVQYDPQSRVNSFAHVNHTQNETRLGVLLCINGTGIANAWLRRTLGDGMSYPALNDLAASAPVGSNGISFLPFGNGAERMLGNRATGAQLLGVDFNRHDNADLARAVQEGIVFAFAHGIDILRSTGVDPSVIRAGRANMMLSPLFRQTLATAADATIELYETDGADGAARGAGLGQGIYDNPTEAFDNLEKVDTIHPAPADRDATTQARERWEDALSQVLKSE